MRRSGLDSASRLFDGRCPGITELSTVEWQSAHVTESRDVIVGIDRRLKADDGIHPQQRDCGGRAREINFVEDAGWQRVASTFSPTFSLVVGSTCFSTTSFR